MGLRYFLGGDNCGIWLLDCICNFFGCDGVWLCGLFYNGLVIVVVYVVEFCLVVDFFKGFVSYGNCFVVDYFVWFWKICGWD